MSEKHLVCHGAICQCKYGAVPDKLKVSTQSMRYINDKDGSKKLIATHADKGATFEANTFGPCKMQPRTFGYKPCQASVVEWSGYYEKIKVEDNNGYALLEDSKATCPIGGKDCISIVFHGQTAEVTQKNVENAREEVLVELLPFVSKSRKVKKFIPINE